jgi:hypothetical protein
LYTYCGSPVILMLLMTFMLMQYQNMNHENRDEISRHAPSITAALNKLLYPSYDRKADFLESVWNGSLSRATISASIYEAMLMDSVAASNCFSLLKIAMDVGCDRLSHACFEQSTRHFLTAMDLDRNGLVELPIDILKTMIQSDFLNVEKEEQVLTAICMWVEHDLVVRMDSFVDLFATGIRFSQIDYYRLANIMEMCDLVAANHAATELAAHELIQKTMGTNRENAMGMGTICRPRRPYRTMTLNNEKNLENLRTIFSSASYVEPLIMLDIPETDKENIASNIFIDGLSQGLLSPSKRLENEMFNSNNERITRRTLQNLT